LDKAKEGPTIKDTEKESKFGIVHAISGPGTK